MQESLRLKIIKKLGANYREARLLRRFIRLLEEAERTGVDLEKILQEAIKKATVG